MIRIAEVVVNQSPPAVWSIVTDPSKFHGLKLPGTYSNFESAAVQSGTRFRYRGLAINNARILYVVDWVPHRVFSFGHDPDTWSFRFELVESTRGTRVVFRRDLRDPSWITRVMWMLGKENELQRLTDATADAIEGACVRLDQGMEDGVFVDKWDFEES